ncbi:MAG: histidinol phosphatase [Bacteroidetes bacterium MedPE-SWsnd-G2]|nr:MAG: histidinol phosphatase [Bacteroidetes bacterium MedPE-SWsnd-G2]
MFFNFKSKPKLKELIPEGYVDIHSHVLCGIDDGAKTPSDSKALLEAMKAMNFAEVIATPHTIANVWDNTSQTINDSLYKVSHQYKDLSSDLKLRAASEYMMDYSFNERLASGPLLTLKDNYVLVEMSYLNPPIQLFELLFELQTKGYTPILAHPERYNFYHNDLKTYDKLKSAGCVFQLNLLSTVGYYGKHVQKTAQHLLKSGLITYVGSDIHHSKHIAAFDQKVQLSSVDILEQALASNRFFKL